MKFTPLLTVVVFGVLRTHSYRMKRIAHHPHIHPAQPWCVFETGLDEVERLPKIALFATRQEAERAHPDASVDAEFAWECQLRITP